MKTATHPKYEIVEISCACGATLTTRSTEKMIRLDICASCHPFFTGTQKIVDTEGRVERFKKKYTTPVKTDEKAKPTAKAKAKTTAKR